MTLTAAVSWSPAVSLSAKSDEAAVVVFVIVEPDAATSIKPSRVSVSLSPIASDGIVQAPLTALYVPALTVPLLAVAVKFAGKRSVRETFVVSSGPLLVTTISNETVSPILATEFPDERVFTVSRSAVGTGATAVTRKLSYAADSSLMDWSESMRNVRSTVAPGLLTVIVKRWIWSKSKEPKFLKSRLRGLLPAAGLIGTWDQVTFPVVPDLAPCPPGKASKGNGPPKEAAVENNGLPSIRTEKPSSFPGPKKSQLSIRNKSNSISSAVEPAGTVNVRET